MVKLLDRALPPTWVDDLTANLSKGLVAQAKRSTGARAPAFIRRAFEADVREALGDPEALRERVAGKIARARSDAEARAAAVAFVARELEKLTARITRTIVPAHVERLAVELALHDEARQIHRAVQRWMPTDGPDGVREWLDHEACALGTALAIYWRTSPHWYRQWEKRSDVPKESPWQRKFFTVLKEIERRVERSEFPHAGITFDPTAFGPTRDDLTIDRYSDEPRRWEIPASMLVRVDKDGVESLPPRRARKPRRG